MQDDPLRLQLRRELRELRKDHGAFDPDQVARCEALIHVVGMGSVEQAHSTLREMFRRYSVEPEGDIRAYLETSGVGLEGRSLNDRLDAYAAAHHVERRTGLRRSDRGADKLATLFRDEEVFFRPSAHLNMYQFGERVLVTIVLQVQPGSEYRPPKVWVNDEVVPDLDFQFGAPKAPTRNVRAAQHIDQFTLQTDRQWLFKIDVEWRMPVWPQWVLSCQLADNRLVTKVQTQRNYMTEATITWGAWPGGVMSKSEAFKSFGWKDDNRRRISRLGD